MLHCTNRSKNGQSKSHNGSATGQRPGRWVRNIKPRPEVAYDPSLLFARGDPDDLPSPIGNGAGAVRHAFGGEQDSAATLTTTQCVDESFLLAGVEADAGPAAADADEGVGDDWFTSEAYRLVSAEGSDDLPGNFAIRVPKWCLGCFQDIERAVIFAQILYWLLPGKDGRIRARRRDREKRPVMDKTHRELADELGLRNERRIEKALKAFKRDGLLDYDPRYGTGKGRTTRIWLVPEGIRRAYVAGCERIAKMERRPYDKNGGS